MIRKTKKENSDLSLDKSAFKKKELSKEIKLLKYKLLEEKITGDFYFQKKKDLLAAFPNITEEEKSKIEDEVTKELTKELGLDGSNNRNQNTMIIELGNKIKKNQ
jgi:hypothetical protein